MLEEHLDLPFQTDVLGMCVTVERIDLTDAEEIVAVLELPLPVPLPQGAE